MMSKRLSYLFRFSTKQYLGSSKRERKRKFHPGFFRSDFSYWQRALYAIRAKSLSASTLMGPFSAKIIAEKFIFKKSALSGAVFPIRALHPLAIQFARALARSETFLNSGVAFCGSHCESCSIVSW